MCTLGGNVTVLGDGRGVMGGARWLVDDSILLQRFKKLFPACPDVASSLGKGSDVTKWFDIALLARPS